MQKRLIIIALFVLSFVPMSFLTASVAGAAPSTYCNQMVQLVNVPMHHVSSFCVARTRTRQAPAQQIRQRAVDPACDASMLEIIAPSSATICFTGIGEINLRDFSFPGGGTWDNQASEALTGQWRVVFASGNNLTGKHVPARKSAHLFFARTSIGDEQLSSFAILSLG